VPQSLVIAEGVENLVAKRLGLGYLYLYRVAPTSLCVPLCPLWLLIFVFTTENTEGHREGPNDICVKKNAERQLSRCGRFKESEWPSTR